MITVIFLVTLIAAYYVTMAVTATLAIRAFIHDPFAALDHPSGGSWLVSWLGWFVAGNYIILGLM